MKANTFSEGIAGDDELLGLGPTWNEADRLEALDSYNILDTPPEDDFDNLARLAAEICDTPIALVSFIAKDKQWFKATVGLNVRETPLAASICKHAIFQRGLFVIPDTTKDPRFVENSLVTGDPHVRFYAGAPLITPRGMPVGMMCILDNKPRELSQKEGLILTVLARQVVIQLELRRSLKIKTEALDALTISEVSYRRLFEAAEDGILILDVNSGRIDDVNPFLTKLLGFSREEMVGKTVGELSPFKDIVPNQVMLGELQAHGYVRYENLPLETREGRAIAVEFVSNIYQAGDRKVIQCNIRDITERQKAEQHLNLLNTCVANLNDIIIVTDAEPLDEPGPRILFVNDAFERMTGYSPAEAIGRSPRFLQGEGTDRVVLSEIRQALADHKPIRRQIIDYKKDGTPYWIDIDIVPIFNPEGKCTHFAAIERDVTESKRHEARFRRLVDSNVQGVFFWNHEGAITGANDSFLEMLQSTRENLEAGQLNWADLTPPEYIPVDRHAKAQIEASGTSVPYEKEFMRKDGTRLPVLIGAATFEDNPQEGVCFVVDLTARKKLEHQFLRAQRMESIGTLAGGIAHDLNNILTPILLSIDVLKFKATDPQARSMLETIEESAKRGAEIVGQVLSFAKGIEGERIDVQANHFLKEIESIIRDTFPKNIRLKVSLPKDTWTILGDPTQIHQILLNLCVNARDAMPGGGNLNISIENCVFDEQYVAMNIQAKTGRYVQINVEDSGSGMPPAILDKIFEPFFTTKEVGKGTGLGLSTVMAIAKSHGGFINVYSEPLMGTTFKVYLPASDRFVVGQWEQPLEIVSPRGNGETVLVVDDEDSILTITSQTLEAFGYRVITARNGAEAIAVYADNKSEVSVVLTDMAMPVMDGPSTIRALMRINPTIKIIAASGLKPEGLNQNPGIGVRHFLTKPYTAATLLSAVRAILDQG